MLSDAASSDTAVLGILGGATAQVSVSLPVTADDDLLDDDVVDDEVDFGAVDGADDDGAAYDGAVVDDAREAEASAGDAPDDQPVDDGFEAEVIEAEVIEDEVIEDDDAEALEDDVVPDAATGDVADDGVADDDLADDDAADDDEDEDAGADAAAGPLAEDADADPAAAQDAAAAADGSADSDIPPATRLHTVGSASDASEQVVDADPVEAEQTGSSAKVTGDRFATAAEEASMDETRSGRAHERARTHEVERVHPPRFEQTLTSKRLDQFEVGKETSDLLTADRLLEHGTAGGEPEGTWQHFVYSLSGGRINLGDGKRARARKELTRRIAAPLNGGARFVPVLSRKGGVGKTTITTLLGMALADARDDRVIAIDANPDRGTLAERIARPSGKTVRDLVRMKGAVNGYNDVSTVVARDETRLDVLASDADPNVSEAFSDEDYEDVAALAAHYYSIVLTDTGTGIVHSVMGATLGLADQLVIVSGLSIDEARLASETLTWLEANGYADLTRSAVVVLNNARPGTPLVSEDELEAHFSTRVRTVVRMPYDPLIATGSAISFRDLQPATREAARELAVTVVEGLRSLAAAA
nr:MinD/ParA family protein [Microbacterium bovistercoris]